MRVIVVDDEAPARLKLRQLLEAEPDVTITAECVNGPEAVLAIRENTPDLLLLDIQMPDMDGFEVLQQIGEHVPAAVIFVTAFDQHAVRAFEVHALDYLLKPVERDRFEAAMVRARTAVQQAGSLSNRVAALLAERPDYLKRLVIREVGQITLVPVRDVIWIEAADNYARVHTASESYYLRMTLKELDQRLDPAEFVRVHRSAIVAIDHIAKLETASHGDYLVVLKDGQSLTASRTYVASLLEVLR
jgi:two-component system LytT family response regulator